MKVIRILLAFAIGDMTKPDSVLLKVMPASGSEARDVCQIQGDFGSARLIWTPDGQRILFLLRRQDSSKLPNTDQNFDLWQVASAGGSPQPVGLTMERLRDLSIHPDGKRLAFSAGQNKPEVWVMESFLPKQSASESSRSAVSKRR